MNYGIIHNRRPESKAAGDAGLQALLADPRLRGIAQQMGLRPADFGNEAQQLWGALNDMAANDPKRYEAFIHEQLQDGPPSNQATNEDDTASSTPNEKPGAAAQRPRFFTPRPGFVVKCAMYHSVKCQRQETKLFLNCCAHDLVGLPTNPNNGKPVPSDTREVPNTNNLQIPLLVGKPRELRDASGDGVVSVVIDVVFHDWVLQRCAWDVAFKRDILKLAIHWVQQDAKVVFVSPAGKFIKSRYKGGVQVGSDIITSKFYLDGNSNSSSSKPAIATPSDLLQQLTASQEADDRIDENIVIEPAAALSTSAKNPQSNCGSNAPKDAPLAGPVNLNLTKTAGPSAGKMLIEEINPPTTSTIDGRPRSEQPPKRKKKPDVVKRGFLNSSKAPLYPSGSGEGRKPSAYVNLLHRSKVVDMRDAPAKHQAHEKESDGIASFLGTDNGTRSTNTTKSGEIDHGDFEFEQLCMKADPDLNPAQPPAATTSDDTDRQVLGEGFTDLARFLTT